MMSIQKDLIMEKFWHTPYYYLYSHKTDNWSKKTSANCWTCYIVNKDILCLLFLKIHLHLRRSNTGWGLRGSDLAGHGPTTRALVTNFWPSAATDATTGSCYCRQSYQYSGICAVIIKFEASLLKTYTYTLLLLLKHTHVFLIDELRS